jgi:hypothetical protein
MKLITHNRYSATQGQTLPIMAASEDRKPVITHFGDAVDVRNRGALRISRFAGSQMHAQDGAGRGALMGGRSMP